jgi:hypothetical protein
MYHRDPKCWELRVKLLKRRSRLPAVTYHNIVRQSQWSHEQSMRASIVNESTSSGPLDTVLRTSIPLPRGLAATCLEWTASIRGRETLFSVLKNVSRYQMKMVEALASAFDPSGVDS